MDKEEIMLHEYNTLRTEIENSFGSAKRILAIGLGIMGALFTGGVINQINNIDVNVFGSLLLISFLILVIPLVSLVTLAMWLGEYQRIQRAGKYLVGLENKINALVDEDVLNWENHLKKNNLHMRYPYASIIVLMIVISVLSHIGGSYLITILNKYLWFALQGIIFLFQLGGFWYLIRQYIDVRNKINKVE